MSDETEAYGEYGRCTATSNNGSGEQCRNPAINEEGYCASHQRPDPENTRYGRCEAMSKTRGERCGRAAVDERGKCDFHGGKVPTAEENPKQGRGDQEGNGNAITHGATANPLNLYRHLDDDEVQWVDSLVQGYVDHLDLEPTDPRLERLLRACVHIYQSWSAEDHILQDGISENTVVGVNDEGNPIMTREGHHLNQFSVQRDKQANRILKEMGAFDDTGSSGPDLGNLSSDSYTIVIDSDTDTDTGDSDTDD